MKKLRTLNELRQSKEFGYRPPSPTRINQMSGRNLEVKPEPLKREVLGRLKKLKDRIFKYGDYHHYEKYDFNVEATLDKLDEVIEAVKSNNKKYGIKHFVNRIIDEDNRN